MSTYTISKSFTWQGKITEKVAALCRMFGLTTDRLTKYKTTHECSLEFGPGEIVLITGPSGSGKTVLLKELQKAIPPDDRINLNQIDLPSDRTVIDCFDTDIVTSIRLLGTAGLSDVYRLVNQPANLSEGEQYRFRLAIAMSQETPYIFADEFCSNLDRLSAMAIGFKIWQFARKTGTTFILATAHDDFSLDLSPDVLVVTNTSGENQVIYRNMHEIIRPRLSRN